MIILLYSDKEKRQKTACNDLGDITDITGYRRMLKVRTNRQEHSSIPVSLHLF